MIGRAFLVKKKKKSQSGHRVPLIDLPLSSGVRRRGQREIERYFAAAAAAAAAASKNIKRRKSIDEGNKKSILHLSICEDADKESGIFNALANALTAPANRALKEMSSQLPGVCPFDSDHQSHYRGNSESVQTPTPHQTLAFYFFIFFTTSRKFLVCSGP